MIDGQPLDERSLPNFPWMLTAGRNVAQRDIRGTGRERKMSLRVTDVEAQSVLFEAEYDDQAQMSVVEPQAVAVCEPSGRFQLVDVRTGRVRIDEQLQAVADLQNIRTLVSGNELFLMVSAPSLSKENQPIAQPDYPLVNGLVYAFSLESGTPLWPGPALVRNRGIALAQPSDIPLLVFVDRKTTRDANSGGSSQIRVLCLDKRTGQTVYRNDGAARRGGKPLPHSGRAAGDADRRRRVEWGRSLSGDVGQTAASAAAGQRRPGIAPRQRGARPAGSWTADGRRRSECAREPARRRIVRAARRSRKMGSRPTTRIRNKWMMIDHRHNSRGAASAIPRSMPPMMRMNRRSTLLMLSLIGATALMSAAPAAASIENPRVRKVVSEGLDWLAYNQHKLGHWKAQGRYPTAMTALAGLAFLWKAPRPRQGKYSENIRRAVDYIVRQSRPNGLIGDPLRDDRYTYGHGFSMLFLSQVLGDEEDEDRRADLVDVLTRAVKFTGQAQTQAGGWGYVSAKDGGGFDEGSTTITQVQGLRGCRNAGIPVPKEIIDKAVQYIKDCTLPDGGVQYSSKGGGGRPAITAAAIACLFNAGEYDDDYRAADDEVLRTESRRRHAQQLRTLALCPLLLCPGAIPRRGRKVGCVSQRN